MNKSDSIIDAIKILDLPAEFSINDINLSYKELLFKWHPDHCEKIPEECKEMTQKIIEAYKTLTAFCFNYKFSPGKENAGKTAFDDPEAFWDSKFGNDPLWGFPDKKE
ncbi:MAG: J domain-containing protein [Spirochaetes bacterium]|nr:J domain-containing protein [Spirochaetota bacterium]